MGSIGQPGNLQSGFPRSSSVLRFDINTWIEVALDRFHQQPARPPFHYARSFDAISHLASRPLHNQLVSIRLHTCIILKYLSPSVKYPYWPHMFSDHQRHAWDTMAILSPSTLRELSLKGFATLRLLMVMRGPAVPILLSREPL